MRGWEEKMSFPVSWSLAVLCSRQPNKGGNVPNQTCLGGLQALKFHTGIKNWGERGCFALSLPSSLGTTVCVVCSPLLDAV